MKIAILDFTNQSVIIEDIDSNSVEKYLEDNYDLDNIQYMLDVQSIYMNTRIN